MADSIDVFARATASKSVNLKDVGINVCRAGFPSEVVCEKADDPVTTSNAGIEVESASRRRPRTPQLPVTRMLPVAAATARKGSSPASAWT